MKSKKLLFGNIVIVIAVIAIAVFSVINGIAKKPTVTEQDFPFTVTYELNGKTETIEDVFSVHYEGNGGYSDTKSRFYTGEIVSLNDEGSRTYVLKEDSEGRITLDTQMFPDYLMGDPMYEYFNDGAFEPKIYYYDTMEVEYADEETLSKQGVKLISWEYPVPIENSFVFSHISIANSEVLLPTLIISGIALLVCVIFVKKEKDLVPKPINVVSVIFNFLIVFTAVPFFSVICGLMDATGDNGGIFSQALYFTPALTLLGIASSVCLRKKGYGKISLAIQFIVPVLFVILVILGSVI